MKSEKWKVKSEKWKVKNDVKRKSFISVERGLGRKVKNA